MLSTVSASAAVGINGQLVQIECDLSAGLPGIKIVGLPARAVDEAKERIRSAITNSGLKLPPRRITLNLAPADLPKEGCSYDLGLAIAIMAASEQIPSSFADALFCGELALDGTLRPVSSALIASMLAAQTTTKVLYISTPSAQQAAFYPGTTVYPVSDLRSLYYHLTGEQHINPQPQAAYLPHSDDKNTMAFTSIVGQDQAKRALQIAAAGSHNLLMSGAPGIGKSLLASALPSLMPPLTHEEAIEVAQIHNAAGNPMNSSVIQRPFRAPHHTASDMALLGGGRNMRPGEISLSHNGILFMDELPEFSRRCLEALRQPLETGSISILRAAHAATYPARFMLVATSNPCPCGYFGDPQHDCSCSLPIINQYQNRLSGPLLDRIDLHITLHRINPELFQSPPTQEPIDAIIARVAAARQLQTERQGSLNSRLSHAHKLPMTASASRTLSRAADALNLSGRSYHKTISIARTIADLESTDIINADHIAESLQYRIRK